MVKTFAVASLLLATGTAMAQPAAGRPGEDLRTQRYQIGVMERILEEAVEHGATLTRDRLRALLPPADMLLAENARVRGFRLDGYGVFFDVVVPNLEGTLAWSFRTLDQNALGLENAINALRGFIEKTSDANLEQALKRIELQVASMPGSLAPAGAVGAQALPAATPSSAPRSGAAATTAAADRPDPAADPILSDPDEAYRSEIQRALMDAMLEHSRGLSLAAEDWLVVAARRDDDRPRLAPVDTDARTVQIRVRGADLAAFLGGRISREDARKRMEVRVF